MNSIFASSGRVHSFCVLLLLSAAAAFAQEGNIIIDHADSLVGLEINGEKARALIGNVRFHQGKIIVTCQKAVQNLVTRKVTMEGVVEVRDDTVRMVSSRGTYDADSRIAEGFDRVMLEDRYTTLHAGYGKYFIAEKKAFFTTHVIVQDTASVLTSNELTYDRDRHHLTADGNVIIVNDKDHLTVTGGHFEHFQERRYSVMTVRPLVTQIDTTDAGTPDTLTISCRLLEMTRDSLPRIVANDSVRMFRSEIAAEAGRAVFYTASDSIILRRSPFVWYATGTGAANQISGDSIWVQIRNRKLESIIVRGRAVAIEQADSLYPHRFNQMSGQLMTLRFARNKLSRIDVERTATSLYFLFDGAKPNGLNKTSGDRVSMTFQEGKIDKISVLSDVQGQYVPERLVRGREEEYNLEGFNYRVKITRTERVDGPQK